MKSNLEFLEINYSDIVFRSTLAIDQVKKLVAQVEMRSLAEYSDQCKEATYELQKFDLIVQILDDTNRALRSLEFIKEVDERVDKKLFDSLSLEISKRIFFSEMYEESCAEMPKLSSIELF